MSQQIVRQGNGEKPRILLVNPPYYTLFKQNYSYNKYPLSLGYLAGAIRKETDWVVTVYNADFFSPSETWQISFLSGEGFANFRANLSDPHKSVWNRFRNILNEIKPNVIGIYINVGNCSSGAILAAIAKEFDKKTIIILGGPHPTSIGKEAMHDQNVDVVVKGEGEQTIVELLQKIEESKSLETVEGIIFRDSNVVVENADREPICDLDSLCFPSEHAEEMLIDYEKYPVSAFNQIRATRGCPHKCFFCGSRIVFPGKTKLRSVENVVDEIKFLRKKGIKLFEFLDDTFGVNKTYLMKLCNSLTKNCPGIRWNCYTHANLITEETVMAMKNAGCYQIEMGIESGNNRTLSQMRKGITIEQAISAAEIISRSGIENRANFLLGFPDETEETLNDTFNAMKKISGRIGYSVFTPYPGTEAFEYCKNAGLVGSGYDPSLYNHQSPENCFYTRISKKRFREIANEIEKYVDKRNSRMDARNVFSDYAIYTLLNYGAFRDVASFKRFARSAFIQARLIVKNLVSQ